MDEIRWQQGLETVSRHDYSYDVMDRRTTALRETGEQWRYGYNTRGEVSSAAKARGSEPESEMRRGLQFGYDYDLIGNRVTETVDTPTGPETLVWTANAANELTQREHPSGRWVRGRMHPEAQITEVVGGGTPNQGGGEFEVPVTAANTGQPEWRTLEVKAARAGVGLNGGEVRQTRTGHLWLAGSPETLEYDEDGNLKSDARWLYEWDGENRLRALETRASALSAGVPWQRLEFAYDAQGRRIRKLVKKLAETGPPAIVSDLRFLYDRWNLVAEFEAAGGTRRLERAYAWGRDVSGTDQGAGGVGGLALAAAWGPTPGAQPTVMATCYDGNGNVSAYVNCATGIVRERRDYDAFGAPVWTEAGGAAAAKMPFGFSTKYRDVETDLVYYGFRYHSPGLGRWLNRDPIGEEGGPLYNFALNDSVGMIDGMGLSVLDFSFGFDTSFEDVDQARVERLKADMEEMIAKCVAAATETRSGRNTRPARCPGMNAAALAAINVIAGSAGLISCATPKDGKNWVWEDDKETEERSLKSIRKKRASPTAVLLTKYAIQNALGPNEIPPKAHANEDNSSFLINVKRASKYTFPHEMGHRMRYRSPTGWVHFEGIGSNLMKSPAGSTPDCRWCELILSWAK